MSKPNKEGEIGRATIEYDINGRVLYADFQPTMKVEVPSEVLQKLSSVEANKEIIKENAATVFAHWFLKTNEIELADRDKFEIVTEIVRCSKYFTNNNVKKCVVRFIFREIKLAA